LENYAFFAECHIEANVWRTKDFSGQFHDVVWFVGDGEKPAVEASEVALFAGVGYLASDVVVFPVEGKGEIFWCNDGFVEIFELEELDIHRLYVWIFRTYGMWMWGDARNNSLWNLKRINMNLHCILQILCQNKKKLYYM
jgi:hypothetical protein